MISYSVLIYTHIYTHFLLQFTKQVKGKVVSLKTSHEINPEEFQRALQPNIVQSLVTLAPLFTCLNDKKKTK